MAEKGGVDAAPGGAKGPDEFAGMMDIPMKIRVEVGRRSMKVREILTLQSESVVALPKSAGENLDIYINGRLLGYGEVVEMEGNAGIRVTDLHESK
ncbi:MAG: flagellar motor switch protein FliN [Acidobacteria bacterium]|nr:flagellar motor switch protein FliN [Acidobacteriota bacterium]